MWHDNDFRKQNALTQQRNIITKQMKELQMNGVIFFFNINESKFDSWSGMKSGYLQELQQAGFKVNYINLCQLPHQKKK